MVNRMICHVLRDSYMSPLFILCILSHCMMLLVGSLIVGGVGGIKDHKVILGDFPNSIID